MTTTAELLRTPFHGFHHDHGAKMVDFVGWDMPLLYTSIIEEHKQVRSSGGMFDVSHMGRVKFTGRHAKRFLDKLCTRNVADMQEGQCRYALVCNEHGGVRDDVLVYRQGEDEFLLVVNASNREKLLGHFEAIKGDLAVKIEDRTMKTGMVALQGPKVIEQIAKVSKTIPELKRYRFLTKDLVMMKLLISRTGYTGEDGVEVILPAGAAKMVMKLLLKEGGEAASLIKPAGLGARDTLRMEAGMPLYGHELGEDINALCCGVDFAINLDKPMDNEEGGFVGQRALIDAKEKGLDKKLVGLILDGKRSARQGMAVTKDGATIGEVTSACVSPTLEKPIAMAFVPTELTQAGASVTIETGRASLPAQVTSLPFYKAPKK